MARCVASENGIDARHPINGATTVSSCQNYLISFGYDNPVMLLDWSASGVDLDGVDLTGLDPRSLLDRIQSLWSSWSASGYAQSGRLRCH
jgi:hypothetical protein